MCSELTPRAPIPDTRIPQLMQPCNHHTYWKSLCSNLWKGTVCLFTNTQGSDKHILLRQKDQGSLNFQVTTWGRRRQLITICRPFKRPLRQLSLGSYVFQKKGIWSNHFYFLGLVSFGFGCRHPICCTKCIASYIRDTELKDQWQATPSSLWLESHSEITPSHSWPLFPRQKFPRPWIFEIALSLSTNWIETKYKLNATPSNKRPTAIPKR